jgi:hypothetical protein
MFFDLFLVDEACALHKGMPSLSWNGVLRDEEG